MISIGLQGYYNQSNYRININFQSASSKSVGKLKPKSEIEKIISSQIPKIKAKSSEFSMTQALYYMVRDCVDDVDSLNSNWAGLWCRINKDVYNAIPILTKFLLSNGNYNMSTKDLVDKMIKALIKNKEELYDNIFQEAEKQIRANEIRFGQRGRDIIMNVINDCFPDCQSLGKAYNDLYNQLWNDFSDNNPQLVLSVIKTVLKDSANEDKDVVGLFSEIEKKIIELKHKNSANVNKTTWTKDQFLDHILKVVISRKFTTSMLKPAEVRNLAKLFKITEEQVKNLDSKTYRKLALEYHPDTNPDNPRATDYFTILNALYNN